MTIKRMTKLYLSIFGTQVLGLDYKIYETRNDLLEEIKHNDLISGKHINTFN